MVKKQSSTAVGTTSGVVVSTRKAATAVAAPPVATKTPARPKASPRTQSTTRPSRAASAGAVAPPPLALGAEGAARTGAAAHGPLTRHTAIAEAAYLLAHQRGFEPGHELDDWLAAETDYDSRCAAQSQAEHA